MKKNILVIILLFSLVFIFSLKSFPWGIETHAILSKYAALFSSSMASMDFFNKLNMERGPEYQFIKKGNNGKSAIGWMQYGAKLEDGPWWDLTSVRSSNHFHDPLKSFNNAGLSDIRNPLWGAPLSLVVWAQDQSNWSIPGEKYSWDKVRKYFFQALTSNNEVERNEYYCEMFRGLGQQVHLIQDAAVPEHVRNDAHLLNAFPIVKQTRGGQFRSIEGWADNNQNVISNFASKTPLWPQVTLYPSSTNPLVPIFHLVDYGVYNGSNPSNVMEQGLAEYTNANFVSEDTLLTENASPGSLHYFPYPRLDSTDIDDYVFNGVLPQQVQATDGKQDFIVYLKKNNHGELITHFLRTNYFSILFRGNTERLKETLFTDHYCYIDYASMLIPRAVGYSAKLLDYFFKNTNAIEISVPQNGIYAMDVPQYISYPYGSSFSKLKIMAKNIAAEGINLVNGEIKLVVSYRLGQGDVEGQFKNPPNPPFMGFSYITANPSAETAITTIPREAIELEFNLSQPIPENATDIRLMLVFQGNFENESNNVAIGFKDINEPTPLDCFNNMDKICLFNTWYDAGTDAAANVVDLEANGGNGDGIAQEWDIRKHNMVNVCIKFSPANNGEMASFTDFDYKFERIDAGEWRRIFVLTDNQFNASWASKIEAVPFGPHSTNWGSYFTPELALQPAINNSLEYLGYGSPEYGEPPVHMYLRHYPQFSPYRSIANCWDLIGIANREYPANSVCATELLNAPLKASSALAAAQIVKDENGKNINMKLKANTGKIYMQKIESRDSHAESQKDKNKK